MRITVNGNMREVGDETTVAALLAELAGSGRGSAAVVDGEVVPRGQWSERVLHPGAQVELITAVQGG